jgi:hypothetical protein
MRYLRRARALILSAFIALIAIAPAYAGFAQFVTRSGSTLYVGATAFRFAGFNLSAPAVANNWLPDGAGYDRDVLTHFQIDDAMATANEMGVTVVRVWSAANTLGSVQAQAQSSTYFAAINATSLQQTDYVLESAAAHNVRVIFTLLEGYNCQGRVTGGKDVISDWTGTDCTNFYTDAAQIAAFENFITSILTHTNPLTGVAYRNDPTILGWEIENEGQGTTAWNTTMSSYIKGVDPNHLVIWGSNQVGTAPTSSDLAISNIDIYNTHQYAGAWDSSIADTVAGASKAYIVEEYSLDEATSAQFSTDEGDTNFSGDLFWELVTHGDTHGWNHLDGHPFTGDIYAGYYPGYSSSDQATMQLIRTHAYNMSGISVPSHQVPAQPTIMAVDVTGSGYDIWWRGSAGASSYTIERSTTGPTSGFSTICNQCATDWDSPWTDSTASGEVWYRITPYNLDNVSGTTSAVYDSNNGVPWTVVNDATTGSGANQFDYTGSWTSGTDTYGDATYRNNDYHESTTAGDSVSFEFSGTQVTLYGGSTDFSGIADISIDSGTPVAVDLYSHRWLVESGTSTDGDRGGTVFYTSPVLSNATHTLTLTNTGIKDPASTGISIRLDAAIVQQPDEEGIYPSSPTYAGVEDSDAGTGGFQVNYSGSWTPVTGYTGYGYHNNDEHYSANSGDSATVSFTGSRIRFYGGMNSAAGIAGCKIDSGTEVDADAYLNVTDLGNQLLCDSGDLAYGSHTLTVRETGSKNGSSSGYHIAVDRFVVTTAEEIDDQVTGTGNSQFDFSGSWVSVTGYPGYGFFNDSEHYSHTTNDTVTIPFSGTRIQVFAVGNTATGYAGCTIDGGTEVLADTYAPSSNLGNQPMCDSGNLAPGSHTLVIRVTGTYDSSSSGPTVGIDRTVITR